MVKNPHEQLPGDGRSPFREIPEPASDSERFQQKIAEIMQGLPRAEKPADFVQALRIIDARKRPEQFSDLYQKTIPPYRMQNPYYGSKIDPTLKSEDPAAKLQENAARAEHRIAQLLMDFFPHQQFFTEIAAITEAMTPLLKELGIYEQLSNNPQADLLRLTPEEVARIAGNPMRLYDRYVEQISRGTNVNPNIIQSLALEVAERGNALGKSEVLQLSPEAGQIDTKYLILMSKVMGLILVAVMLINLSSCIVSSSTPEIGVTVEIAEAEDAEEGEGSGETQEATSSPETVAPTPESTDTRSPEATSTQTTPERLAEFEDSLVQLGILSEDANIERLRSPNGKFIALRLLDDSSYGKAGTLVVPGIDGPVFYSPEGASVGRVEVVNLKLTNEGRVEGYDGDGNLVSQSGEVSFNEESGYFESRWLMIATPTGTASATETPERIVTATPTPEETPTPSATATEAVPTPKPFEAPANPEDPRSLFREFGYEVDQVNVYKYVGEGAEQGISFPIIIGHEDMRFANALLTDTAVRSLGESYLRASFWNFSTRSENSDITYEDYLELLKQNQGKVKLYHLDHDLTSQRNAVMTVTDPRSGLIIRVKNGDKSDFPLNYTPGDKYPIFYDSRVNNVGQAVFSINYPYKMHDDNIASGGYSEENRYEWLYYASLLGSIIIQTHANPHLINAGGGFRVQEAPEELDNLATEPRNIAMREYYGLDPDASPREMISAFSRDKSDFSYFVTIQGIPTHN